MNQTLPNPKSSELYRKIAGLPLSPATRTEALAALEIAERLINLLMRKPDTTKTSPAIGSPKTA